MALTTRRRAAERDLDLRDRRVAETDVVDDRVVDSTSTHEPAVNGIARAVASIAAAVPLVIGIIALVRLDWGNGFDAAPVSVAGMTFTPGVAIATTVIALIALAAAASADRASKLTVGVLLAAVGIALLLAGNGTNDWRLQDGHGWMALIVGAVLVVAGMLIRHGYAVRREVRGRRAAY